MSFGLSEKIAEELSPGAGDISRQWTGRVSVALPLQESTAPLNTPPAAPRSLADPFEPASLYLFGPRYADQQDDEDQRVQTTVPLPIKVDHPPAWSEIVSFKDADARRRGWDFANTLWVHVSMGEVAGTQPLPAELASAARARTST